MAWADKYRAKSFSELIVKPDILRSVIAWVNQWRAGAPEKKILLLHGPPGVGKTTFASVISSEMGLSLVEMNSSERRNEDSLRITGKMAGLYRDLLQFEAVPTGPDKIILIDEADNIFEGRSEASDSGGMRALAEIAETTRNPVIVTMNDFYEFRRKSHSREVLDNALQIELVPYHRKNEKDYSSFRTRLKERMARICEIEGVSVPENIIDGIIDKNGTDIRASLNDLESMRYVDGTPGGFRDQEESLYKVVETILFRGEMDRAVEVSRDGDFTPEDLLMWLDQNAHYVGVEDSDRAAMYRLISYCDVMIGRVTRKQHYAFKGYAEELACGIRHLASKPYGHYVKFQFPSYIRNLARIKSGGYARKGLEAKLSRYTHMGPDVVRNHMWFFSGMAKHRPDLFREISRKLMIRDEEIGYL